MRIWPPGPDGTTLSQAGVNLETTRRIDASTHLNAQDRVQRGRDSMLLHYGGQDSIMDIWVLVERA